MCTSRPPILIAAEALRRIGEVYAIEARIRCLTAAQRLAVRQVETTPLMAALRSWLMERLAEISTKSSLAAAIRYTLGHWQGLTVFLGDGRVEVDNNTVERSIRPIPLGRKNALFAGSAAGGERWAVLASLINTAKLHGSQTTLFARSPVSRHKCREPTPVCRYPPSPRRPLHAPAAAPPPGRRHPV